MLARPPEPGLRARRGDAGRWLRVRCARCLTAMRTYVRAMGQPEGRGRGAAASARLPRPRRGAEIRRAGGSRHKLLRGAGEIRAQQSPARVADAVSVDGEPVQGM